MFGGEDVISGRFWTNPLEPKVFAYELTPEYAMSLASDPDVVVLMLGTNDAQRYVRPTEATDFYGDATRCAHLSSPHISLRFHSFRLMFGRFVISPRVHEAWTDSLTHSIATHFS